MKTLRNLAAEVKADFTKTYYDNGELDSWINFILECNNLTDLDTMITEELLQNISMDNEDELAEYLYNCLESDLREWEEEEEVRAKKEVRANAIDELEAVLEEHASRWRLKNLANTGTLYYEFTIDNGDSFSVRFADHSDCYCNTDYNVAMTNDNLDGYTIKSFKEIIIKLQENCQEKEDEEDVITETINRVDAANLFESILKNAVKSYDTSRMGYTDAKLYTITTNNGNIYNVRLAGFPMNSDDAKKVDYNVALNGSSKNITGLNYTQFASVLESL
ncbi:MAG: hypothetical protein M0P35_00595 [Bacteroidales bacterium]|jgi:hypothetical protein|nr:hypothetical protein [Bacteroidales bacterium]